MRQHMVRAERQFRLHVPVRVAGNFEDERLEASAVRHRLVEPPNAAAYAPGARDFADHSQDGKCFIHFSVAAVDSGNVTAGAIAAQQNNSAGKSAFENGQYVVAINPEFAPLKLSGLDKKVPATLSIFLRTSIAGDGHALARGERMAVAHQFNCRAGSVTAIEQPAEVICCGAQRGKLPCRKKPLILRSRPAVCLTMRHKPMLSQVPEKIIPGFELNRRRPPPRMGFS